ncbi:uncharacterized protein LOC120696255 [Panicum virgatum]|uniref:Uncharacterized protein n=1 Tax=Panicum virgatum TaxID=38727 RepID=A0A8T0WQC5_PANVG|nr:uncharacterized protein LOC120696255 [Panicum virgatum]KAG2647314.1 hypothetical protein PVAP13_2KG578000 [Panicum virgatum]
MADGLLRWLCVLPGRRWRRRRGGRAARLVLWGGEARAADPGTAAGELLAEHAGCVVCRAEGFRIGRPVPVLDIEDRLEAGRTYLVVPVDRLPCGGTDGVVTAALLTALSHAGGGKSSSSSAPTTSLAGGSRSPFEYVKDEDGRTVIRVTEEFIVRAVTGGGGKPRDRDADAGGCGALCSTPELRKHYEQLVGAARGRPWSPRLDTIKERKGRRLVDVVSPGRLSPVRLLGMDKGLSS